MSDRREDLTWCALNNITVVGYKYKSKLLPYLHFLYTQNAGAIIGKGGANINKLRNDVSCDDSEYICKCLVYTSWP